MQPLTVVLGIVVGSAFAVSFSLGVVLLIFVLRLGDDPRYSAELPELARSTAMFAVLTAVAAAAFYGNLTQSSWRRWPLFGLGVSLVAIGFYFYPD